MPTLECLDERSRAILAKLEDMDEHYKATHNEFREAMRENYNGLATRFESLKVDVDARLTKNEEDIKQIKTDKAYDEGRRSGLMLAGGVALSGFSAVCGAIGNVLWQWATSSRGPIGPLH